MRFFLVLVVLLPAAWATLAGHARAQGTPAPYQAAGYAELFQGALDDIDRYWRAQFAASGLPYWTPGVRWLESPETDDCGSFDPQAGPGAYCPLDETIVLSVPLYEQLMADGVDFAWVTVAAHEWGHHVQFLLGIRPGAGSGFELQADCLAGAYAQDAAGSGLLERGDISEAVGMSSRHGDPVWLPADQPGAHGSGDERLTSFMRGYINGVGDCGTPLGDLALTRVPEAPPVAAPTLVTPTPLAIESFLPDELQLTQGQPFRIESEGISTFDDMVAGLPDPDRTRGLLVDWGWQENVYRVFAADDPPPDAVGWVAVGVHRFASVDGAAAALPYFAAARRDARRYEPVDVGLFADQTEAMAGQAVNGAELTIYARRGTLVFRVDGIAPGGDPTPDVFEAMLIPLRRLVDEPRVVSPESFAILPAQGDVPPGLALAEEHARSGGTIAATFPDVAEAERLFQEWGWRESAARVFTGSAPSGGNRLEASVFRFVDDRSAAEALPYFLDARAEALNLSEAPPPPAAADEARAIGGPTGVGHEATAYVRRGRDLFRLTVIGGTDPVADLGTLLGAW